MADAGQGRETESLNGWWHTWLDEAVDWEAETPLPPDTPADLLPRRAPSAGWDGMEWGMESTRVPGTLVQARPGYRGVAWQWRPIVIPEGWEGRTVGIRFGGARQRVEVYLDDRPVGYDIDGLTPFTVDLTPYVRPGRQYELALRVTNPGGWRADEEGGAIPWGEVALPGSRDVGGLWGGVSLVALPSLHLHDIVVLPGAAPHEVVARVTLRNTGELAMAEVRLSAQDAEGHPVVASDEATVAVPAGGVADLTLPLPIAARRRWTPEDPYLTRVVAEVRSYHGADRLGGPLGLRGVAVRDGRLLLNGAPIAPTMGATTGGSVEGQAVPLTAADAERVVAQALSAGTGGLVAQGWPAPPTLLDAADRLGLPVVQTLVGVGDPTGVPAAARGLYEALARDRVRRLIRRDRNHPSVVAWRLAVPRDATVFAAYARLVHDEDPTRPVVSVDELAMGSAR